MNSDSGFCSFCSVTCRCRRPVVGAGFAVVAVAVAELAVAVETCESSSSASAAAVARLLKVSERGRVVGRSISFDWRKEVE